MTISDSREGRTPLTIRHHHLHNAHHFTMVREITKPTALSLPDGNLAPDAAGYSRKPLHTSDNLPHGLYYLWRSKKWDYWGITSPELVLGLTVADLDYANLVQVYLHDRTTGETIEEEHVPLLAGRGVQLPTSLPPVKVFGSSGGITISFEDSTDRTHTTIRVESPRVSAELVADTTGESMSVAVPWGETRYFYTIKAPSLPVSGTVTIDGKRAFTVKHDAWAVLDRGRGRWNYINTWNWAAAGGVNSEGRRVGFTLGETATAEGNTENAFIVDKVLHAGLGPIKWEYDLNSPAQPWRLKSEWIDATLTPWHVRTATNQKIVVSSRTIQAFGQWSGWAVLNDGTRVSLDGLTGFAEDAYQRF